jgi:hypothetical protein
MASPDLVSKERTKVMNVWICSIKKIWANSWKKEILYLEFLFKKR